jgi:signal transduction histidine kinase
LAIISLLPFGLLISHVENRFIFSTGPIFPFFTVYFICLVISFVVYFVYKYKEASADIKKSLAVMSLGLFLSIVISGIVSYLLPALGYVNLAILDAPSGFFFVVFSAYAVLKMQLFDIKVILTETATGIVVLALLIQTIVVDSITQKIISGTVLVLVVYGGYLLIKSVQDEIRKKEQLQVLSKQLADANIHLKDLDKMKTEFVSLASHELLTPVSAIEGYLSMMLDEKLVKIEDPKAIQYMDRVYRSAKRLARLIADMLNISRIEEGRLLVEKKDVNMTELITQVLEELKFKADEHKQKIVFDDKSEIRMSNDESNQNNQNQKFMTWADPDKVKEILVNIIGNSIKYTMNPGTITVTIEKVPTKVLTDEWGKLEAVILNSTVDDQESIHAVADEHMKQILGDEQYLVKIKDQGIGIPKEELPKLFKKFHRVGDFSTAESQGTGLGLYITRALVELHHGRVWPDSEGQGKGSTFTFSLPTASAKQAIIDLEAQSPQTKEQLKPLAKPMGNDDAL